MEKRAVAPLVLGGAGLALAIAVVVLLVKVRAGAPAVSMSPADLSRAGSRPASAPTAGGREASEPQPPSPPPPRLEPRVEPEPPPSPEPAAEPAAGVGPVGIAESAAPTLEPGSLPDKMAEANRLYDRGDYEAANRMAKEVLKEQPYNTKMLRIGASSACILGDPADARVHYEKLPEHDQQQIARRCKRYGVEF